MDVSQEMLFRLQGSVMAVQAAVTASRQRVNDSREILRLLSQDAQHPSNGGDAKR
jgi:hypothetical protein